MPEKDIGFWINLYNIAREQGIALAMVFILTIFRMYRDEKHPSFKLVLFDSIFGSLIVFSVGVTCREFGLSYGWTLATSGFIGVFGLEAFKYYVKKMADKKVEQGYSYKDRYRSEDDEL
ncbi:holin [Entomomonas moraniae]|uniref:Holin n=1 Tax=Entomomonas moraniae TaxID=2213226 RepID=A0A3S9XCC4_9GAMM|nr:phage holin family protein [Entomomonas moraniae]AZS50060.1 holin [Entomomonas moraniae]